jgi:hypothetical protein
VRISQGVALERLHAGGGAILRRTRLGGLLDFYYRQAA